LKRAIPFLICLLHLAVLIYPARQHPFGNYATETDFYHLFGQTPHAFSRRDAENTYQGPGYPVAIALISKFQGWSCFGRQSGFRWVVRRSVRADVVCFRLGFAIGDRRRDCLVVSEIRSFDQCDD
jgi:hypothetical protein